MATSPTMSRLLAAILGALIVGGIGFAAGFFGPILLTDANQGPLLGIFVTGPLGFVLGWVLGALYGPSLKRPPDRREPSAR